MPPRDPILVRVNPRIAPLVPTYLENQRRQLARIRQALAEEALGQVERIGHDLKGTGGGYGFARITELGALLERAAQQGDAESIRQTSDELEDFLARVELIE